MPRVLAFMLRSHDAGTNWHMTFKTQAKKLDTALKAPGRHARRLARKEHGVPRRMGTAGALAQFLGRVDQVGLDPDQGGGEADRGTVVAGGLV